MLLRGAKQIAEYVGEHHTRIAALVEREGLPAWKRYHRGEWKALECDLIEWLKSQRDRYLKKPCQ